MDLKGKVALITGAASGIGLAYSEELLKQGAKVSLCDIDSERGEQVTEKLASKYGRKNVLFCRLDVTDYPQFEEAFVMTVEEFNRIDIVINNAGFMNDRLWELEVDVNLNGVIRGTLLAYRFMGKDRGGQGGVIVNTASTAFARPQVSTPIYTATNYAIVGLTRAYGDQYHVNMTGVRCLVVCPGLTDSGLVKDLDKQLMSSKYETAWLGDITDSKMQSSDHVGRALVDVLAKGQSGSVWIVENAQPAREWRG
ncbi:15-hydroxyprostaglandin dehydrogenase [NAD(+)]-like [Bombyx mandarina]|uniref:15-hydroxyprostaglandin dehydrogenase [NAD(+)] n=2 Tax=Bombyx TaxID=7090 RepID=A0A8R1WKG0_BOMMO|nr:15-hydroxyprostaglandin dehydrogenase [NAD(+)] [Bombyx mori]XP_028029156.1 15-hydroxyprostaglandin dehydrogenase [NAD(+)]-like [Bombyx mandarina]